MLVMGERFRGQPGDRAVAEQALRRPRAVRDALTPSVATDSPGQGAATMIRRPATSRRTVQASNHSAASPAVARPAACGAPNISELPGQGIHGNGAGRQVAVGSRAYISTQGARRRHRNARVPARRNIAQAPLHRPPRRSPRDPCRNNLGSAAAAQHGPSGLGAVAAAASATSAAASSPPRKRAPRRGRGRPRPGRGMSPFALAGPAMPDGTKAIEGHPRPHARACVRRPSVRLGDVPRSGW